MSFSRFGRKMTGRAGILSLMDDLGRAMRQAGGEMIMMGGGNPGLVPEFVDLMRQRLGAICNDSASFQQLVGSYGPPQGDTAFVESLAVLLQEEFGWDIGPQNICLTNGSQTAFFMLFNLFAGEMEDGRKKKICLPLAPEYIGYADLGLQDDLFVSTRPKLELLDDSLFKYHVDFDQLVIGDDIGAICVSRPTNPTGNVISDGEMAKLVAMAKEKNIPLMVDGAYGLPFPGMIYSQATPLWNQDLITCLSLSKLGLPAVRTGIVLAKEEVVQALTGMNAIMSLTPGSFGAILARELMADRSILSVAKDMMYPFYRQKMERALDVFRKEFAGLPCRVHKPEGAMFFWLWFDGLPITSLELYQELKEAGVLVVSGHYFFPGLPEPWAHTNQCLRVTYSQNDEDVRRGLAIIAKVARKYYQ